MPALSRTMRVVIATGASAALVTGLVSALPSSAAAPRAAGAKSATAVPATGGAAQVAASKPAAAVKHVWIINLENESFAYTFGKTGQKKAPYLSKTLPSKGALLKDYYGIGHDSLDNYTAEISGQASNYMLGQDCGRYEPFIQFGGENFDKWTKYHQLSGEGCVYPKYVSDRRQPAQRTQTDLEGLHAGHGEQAAPRQDGQDVAGPGLRTSEARRGRPDRLDRPQGRQLRHPARPLHVLQVDHRTAGVLRRPRRVAAPVGQRPEEESTTPNYSFVTPNTCADAHDTPNARTGPRVACTARTPSSRPGSPGS